MTVAATRETEVAVLGGGPAGTAAALALARAGRSVVVVERARYESARVGEVLPPEARLPLAALGVWDRFLADDPLPSPGVVSVWGAPAPRAHDFLTNPFGGGWLIDRRRFDATLAEAAESRGVEVLRAARLSSWRRDGAGVWCFRLETPEGCIGSRAAVLIDATGRSASPVRRLGGRRIVHDRLVGLLRYLEPESGAWRDRRTLVEAVEDGWWYSAPLPDGRLVAGFMTDADLLPAGESRRRSFWIERLRRARHTRDRIGGATPPGPGLRIVAANTARADRVASPGWLAVGDAAACLDPLSSQGVYRALRSGLEAGAAVDAYLSGDDDALDAFARGVATDFAADLRARSDHYGAERRWPESPFWARRHAPLIRRA